MTPTLLTRPLGSSLDTARGPSHVVVLGGGFSGLRVALSLAEKARPEECTVTLVDQHDAHVNLAVLYEVATAFNPYEREAIGTVLRETASVPLTRILDGSGVVFLQRTVDRIDPETREVHFAPLLAGAPGGGARRGTGDSVVADVLVIALGAQPSDEGIPGVEANTFSIRTLPQAIELRHHLVRQFLQRRSSSRQRQQRAFRAVVVGGGTSGIELAGELVLFLRKLARLHRVDEDIPTVVLLEAASAVLREFPAPLRQRALRRLRELGVDVWLRAAVCEVGTEYVVCGEHIVLPADTVVWLTGNRTHDVLMRSGLPVHRRGGAYVDSSLEVRGTESIFAVGDCAHAQNPVTGKIVPDVAHSAIQQGAVVAENILRRIRGQPLISYIEGQRPILATVGGKFALVHAPPFQFAGRFGWVVKELVNLRYLFSILPRDVALRFWVRSVRVRVAND